MSIQSCWLSHHLPIANSLLEEVRLRTHDGLVDFPLAALTLDGEVRIVGGHVKADSKLEVVIHGAHDAYTS